MFTSGTMATTEFSEYDECSMKIEAANVIKEVEFGVEFIEVSKSLPQSDQIAFINVKIKEGETMCVELTQKGYRVVGKSFDMNDSKEESVAHYYESIDAFLGSVSPGYRKEFSSAVLRKLSNLDDQEEGT